MHMPWIEHLKSTYRWQGFTAWLSLNIVRWLPAPDHPTQQRACLPLGIARQMAEVVDPWLLLVLKERQQRGLGWQEATDAPLFVADLAARPFGSSPLPTQSGRLLRALEGELRRLVRLAEAPERLLPTSEGMPSEARYRAFAVALLRMNGMYRALEEELGRDLARGWLCAVAGRVRRQATAPAAA